MEYSAGGDASGPLEERLAEHRQAPDLLLVVEREGHRLVHVLVLGVEDVVVKMREGDVDALPLQRQRAVRRRDRHRTVGGVLVRAGVIIERSRGRGAGNALREALL